MPKTYHITQEDSVLLRREMKNCEKAINYRRLEAVAMRGEGKKNKEIAGCTGFHRDHVSKLVSLYCREGLSALLQNNRKGGNHKNMRFAEEAAILKGFDEAAQMGQIITPAEIKKRYDEALGRETTPTFIYAVLKRHGWRKIMPRSKHPNKASDEVIEASKKLTMRCEN